MYEGMVYIDLSTKLHKHFFWEDSHPTPSLPHNNLFIMTCPRASVQIVRNFVLSESELCCCAI